MVPPAAVEAYLPLVGAIARTLSRGLPSSVELNELINDGVIGLMGALQRYDPGRGVGFSTYAGHRIRGAMLDGLRRRDPVPRAFRGRRRAGGNGSGASAKGGGIQIVDLDSALALPADDASGPEDLALQADLVRRLRRGLAALPPRDREVIVLRWVHGLPLRDVAARLSLSVTRTTEIQARGLARLRRYMDGEPMIRRRGRTPARGGGHAYASRQEGARGPANRSGTADPAPATLRPAAEEPAA